LPISPEEVDPPVHDFDHEQRSSGPELTVGQTLWLT
jgi:hypothetical protein